MDHRILARLADDLEKAAQRACLPIDLLNEALQGHNDLATAFVGEILNRLARDRPSTMLVVLNTHTLFHEVLPRTDITLDEDCYRQMYSHTFLPERLVKFAIRPVPTAESSAKLGHHGMSVHSIHAGTVRALLVCAANNPALGRERPLLLHAVVEAASKDRYMYTVCAHPDDGTRVMKRLVVATWYASLDGGDAYWEPQEDLPQTCDLFMVTND